MPGTRSSASNVEWHVVHAYAASERYDDDDVTTTIETFATYSGDRQCRYRRLTAPLNIESLAVPRSVTGAIFIEGPGRSVMSAVITFHAEHCAEMPT